MKRNKILTLLLSCVIYCGGASFALAAPAGTESVDLAPSGMRPFGPSLFVEQVAEAVDKPRNERYYALGMMEMKDNNAWRARAAFSKAIAADRTDWRSYLGRGNAFRQMADDRRSSYRSFAASVFLNENSPVMKAPHMKKEYAKKREEMMASFRYPREFVLDIYPAAIRDYDRVLALGPDPAWAVQALRGRGAAHGGLAAFAGDVLRMKRQEDEQLRVEALCGQSPSERWQEETVSDEAAASIEGDFIKALADYGEALRRAPDDASAYAGRAAVYDALGRYRLQAAGAPSGYWAKRALRRQRPEAAERFDLSDYRRAIADYERAAALAPEKASFALKIGDLHMCSYEDDEAFACYARAAAESTAQDSALTAAAGLYLSLDKKEKANAMLHSYLQKHKDMSFAMGVLFSMGSSENVREELLEATDKLATVPEDSKLYAYRADRWRHMLRYPQAVADYTRAVALGEVSAALHWNRGECYQEMKLWKQALADYERAEASGYLEEVRAKENVKAKTVPKQVGGDSRGKWMHLWGNEIDLRSVRKDEESLFFACRAEALFSLGQFAAAARDYTRVIARDPTLYEFYYRRHLCHKELGLNHLAIADLRLILLRYPEFSDVYAKLGAFYADALDDNVAALASYDEAIRLDGYEYTLFQRAVLLDRMGETEKAAADFRRWAKNLLPEDSKKIPEKYRAMLP